MAAEREFVDWNPDVGAMADRKAVVRVDAASDVVTLEVDGDVVCVISMTEAEVFSKLLGSVSSKDERRGKLESSSK